MNKGLFIVIGMTIAYVVSFLGLILAYYSYKKRKRKGRKDE
ncbi:MAG: hypothetical protein AB1410_02215 [Acidobacteriota bacterium]